MILQDFRNTRFWINDPEVKEINVTVKDGVYWYQGKLVAVMLFLTREQAIIDRISNLQFEIIYLEGQLNDNDITN